MPVIVVPMIVSGWVSYAQLKTTTIEKSKQQMGTLLEQYALYADSFIHSVESNIQLFSNNALLQRYMVTQSEEERYEILQPLLMKQLQSYQKAYPLYYEFRLIFPDGFEDLRLVNRSIDNVTMHEAGNPFIKTMLDEVEGVFSRVQRNPDNGELALYVATALNLRDRSIEGATAAPEFRGFLVLTIDISEMMKQMEMGRLGDDGFLFTVDSTGAAELYPEGLADMLAGQYVTRQQMADLMVDQTTTDMVGGGELSLAPIVETSFLGSDGYMKGIKIHDHFVLLAWLPLNEINQKTRDLALIVTGITVIAVLITVILLFSILDYFVLRPIQKLRDAANEIGRGVLTASIDMDHDDEAGDLAKSFDEMRKSMQRSHENLERLVDERTVEVRHALEEVEKSSQAKSNFLSRMSHELRTPLNAILGFSQLYEFDQNLTGHQKANAREINNAGEHLLSLVDEVLDLSKIEAGRLELSLETISLSKVLDNCRVLTSSLAKAHGISIDFEGGKCEELFVYADYMRAKQVFLNLLSNAVKYNQEHGSVSIYCISKEDDFIRINVRDTGPGIADDKLLQLFEPFNRLGAEYSSTEGTGIGLLITKQLVELMGGRLGIESEPGKGSTFWVELKTSTASDSGSGIEYADEPLAVDAVRIKHAENVRILVAEDNETNQEVLRQQLSLLGYHADFVDNGLDALEQWRCGDYQLLLTDIHMPQMDGYELVSSIRKTKQFADNRIPLIAFTADAMRGQSQRCLDAGMDDYIAKPVHMEDLERILGKWLSRTAGNDPSVDNAEGQADAGAAEAGDRAAIDPGVLTRMVGDDPARHRKLLQSFIRSTPEILAEIQAALIQKNTVVLVAQAHKLKSSAQSVGAVKLSGTCQALEKAAGIQQWSEIESLVPELDDLYRAVERYVVEHFTQD